MCVNIPLYFSREQDTQGYTVFTICKDQSKL
jgi:hypothetical protein